MLRSELVDCLPLYQSMHGANDTDFDQVVDGIEAASTRAKLGHGGRGANGGGRCIPHVGGEGVRTLLCDVAQVQVPVMTGK
jgi:hypothetical protein